MGVSGIDAGGVCMYQLPWTPLPLDLELYSRDSLVFIIFFFHVSGRSLLSRPASLPASQLPKTRISVYTIIAYARDIEAVLLATNLASHLFSVFAFSPR